jgi:hypothetical protein
MQDVIGWFIESDLGSEWIILKIFPCFALYFSKGVTRIACQLERAAGLVVENIGDDGGKSAPCESERERGQNPFPAFQLIQEDDRGPLP